jgi:hypothetical protein
MAGRSIPGKIRDIFKKSEHAEPGNVGSRDHDDKQDNENLVYAVLAEAEERRVVFMGIRRRTDPAGLGSFLVFGMIVALEGFVMGHTIHR